MPVRPLTPAELAKWSLQELFRRAIRVDGEGEEAEMSIAVEPPNEPES